MCYNHRGVSGCKVSSDRYHRHADINDFKLCVQNVRKKFPDADIVGVGISMGANYLMKYLG